MKLEQLNSIIEGMAKLKDDDELQMQALFVFTDMRCGEVLGRYNFEKKPIHVRLSAAYAHNQPVIDETKTRSGCSIPLDDCLVHYLLLHMKEGFALGGEALIKNMAFRRTFKHIRDAVDIYGATQHVFRHSYITTLAKADIDLKTIQRISSHTNTSTMLNIYTHTREEEIQCASEEIGKVMGV